MEGLQSNSIVKKRRKLICSNQLQNSVVSANSDKKLSTMGKKSTDMFPLLEDYVNDIENLYFDDFVTFSNNSAEEVVLGIDDAILQQECNDNVIISESPIDDFTKRQHLDIEEKIIKSEFSNKRHDSDLNKSLLTIIQNDSLLNENLCSSLCIEPEIQNVQKDSLLNRNISSSLCFQPEIQVSTSDEKLNIKLLDHNRLSMYKRKQNVPSNVNEKNHVIKTYLTKYYSDAFKKVSHVDLPNWSKFEVKRLLNGLECFGYKDIDGLFNVVKTQTKQEIKKVMDHFEVMESEISSVVQLRAGCNEKEITELDKCAEEIEKLNIESMVHPNLAAFILPIIGRYESWPDNIGNHGIDYRTAFGILHNMMLGAPLPPTNKETLNFVFYHINAVYNEVKEEISSLPVDLLENCFKNMAIKKCTNSKTIPCSINVTAETLLTYPEFNSLNIPQKELEKLFVTSTLPNCFK